MPTEKTAPGATPESPAKSTAAAIALALFALGWIVAANNGLSWGGGALPLDLWTVPLLFLLAGGLAFYGNRLRTLSVPQAAAILSAVLFLYLLSDYAVYKWFFWISLAHRHGLFILAAFLIALFALRPRPVPATAVLLLLVISQGYLTFQFLDATGGLPPLRDDHPSFLYRLQLLRETYPQIVSYDPRWNGGRIASELLQTGILTVAPFFLPVGKLFSSVPMEKLYSPFLSFLFHWVFPWLFYLGLRLFGADRATALWGALLALYPNRYFFINLLPWGVFPSLLAMAFVVPAAGALYRIAVLRDPGWRAGLTLALSLTLASFWPASVFTFLPLALLALAALPRFDRRQLGWLVFAGALFLLLASPWLRGLLASGEISKFGELEKASGLVPDWNSVRRNLEHLNYLSPLLLVFGLPGLLVPGFRPLRRWILTFTAVYLLLLMFGNEYREQYQFLRIVNAASYIMVVPTAFWLGRIFSLERRKDAPVRGLVLAAVFLTVFSAGWIWSNRGWERFSLPGPTEQSFADALKREVPDSARLFWAGRTMHSWGGGHVAPLPYLTGKMMMASDYYHFHRREIGGTYDLLRPGTRKGEGREGRIEAYFDAWNVSHIASSEGRWIEYFDGLPDLYELVWEHKKGDFWLMAYRRRFFTDSLFQEGSGTVEILPGRIRVRIDDPGKRVVLRFAWIEGLATEPPVGLSPHPLPGDIELMEVGPGGTGSFEIYRPGWW